MNNIESNKGEIVMYQPDEALHLEVRVEDETVWLTQQQMSDLFSVKENTVTYHIKEIYKSEELEKEGTARKIRVVRKEGNRNVNRTLDYYNLDMIISVGYKVNSKRGVKFRQWATRVLKDHLLKDNYIDETTLTMLSKRDPNITATIYTRQLNQQQQLDLQRHNQQYPPININTCQHNHDRFLIIDDVVYLFGASLKDAGKKLFAYIKMQETPATQLLSNIR